MRLLLLIVVCIVACICTSCVGEQKVSVLVVSTKDVVLTVDEDQVCRQDAPGILSDYQLKDNAVYVVRVLSDVFNGDLELAENGAVSYAPNENFVGTDSFIFQLFEDGLIMHTGTVRFDVNNVADDPIAVGESYSMREDGRLEVYNPGVLKNDHDPDGDSLRLEMLKQPEHGTLTMQETGSFVYEPHENYNGADSFSYRVHDGTAHSAAVTTQLAVKAINDRPQLQVQNIPVSEGGTVVLSSEHISATDIDNEDQHLAFRPRKTEHCWFTLKSAPKKRLKRFSQSHIRKGNVLLHHDGSNKAPSFRLELSDGRAKVEAQVPIVFIASNDKPVWRKLAIKIAEGQKITVQAHDLRAIDEETSAGDLKMKVISQKHIIVQRLDTHKEMSEWKQSDLQSGKIVFIHDGSESKPQLHIQVSDGEHYIQRDVDFTFTQVNDAPQWKTHNFEIYQGKTLVLTSQQCAVDDIDNKNADLLIAVYDAQHIRFEKKSQAVTSFTFAELHGGAISAIHDGGVDAPSWMLRVSDGTAQQDVAATVRFIRVYRAPELQLAQKIEQDITAGRTAIGSLLQVQITDADSTELKSLRIRLQPQQGELHCTIPNGFDTVMKSQWENGVLHITGVQSIANYVQILQSLSFVPASDKSVYVMTLFIMVEDAYKKSEESTVELVLTVPAPPISGFPVVDVKDLVEGDVAGEGKKEDRVVDEIITQEQVETVEESQIVE